MSKEEGGKCGWRNPASSWMNWDDPPLSSTISGFSGLAVPLDDPTPSFSVSSAWSGGPVEEQIRYERSYAIFTWTWDMVTPVTSQPFSFARYRLVPPIPHPTSRTWTRGTCSLSDKGVFGVEIARKEDVKEDAVEGVDDVKGAIGDDTAVV